MHTDKANKNRASFKFNFKRSVTYIIIILSASLVEAAMPLFDRAENYPNIGLRLPRLSQSKARPLPMPEAHTYLSVRQDMLDREDRFDPFELWFHNQCEGCWQDLQGNTLTIGRIKQRLPIFSVEHITRENFNIEIADSDYQIDGKNKEQIHEWASAFCGNELKRAESLNINSFALNELFSYGTTPTNTLVYTFQPRRIGNARNFDWFCVILQAADVEDYKLLKMNFEDNYLSQISQPSKADKDEGAESTELDTSRKGKKDFDQPNHPVRIASRKSIENYKEWWFAETDGYIILSDVNTDLGKSLIDKLQKEMPLMHKAYRALLPPLTESQDVSLIRIFQFKSDYNQYVGAENAWSGGMWMPQRRELVLTQEFHTEEIMRTIRHESFHQYISYAYCMITPAPWMNEGHACFFEFARVDSNDKVTFDDDNKRAQILLENLDLATDLIPVVLYMTYEEFYAGSSAERSLKYALAWGLAYYLQKGAPLERNTTFNEILKDYAASLMVTRNYGEATALTFADRDMKVFQSNFKEFWLKRRASALQYDPLEDK